MGMPLMTVAGESLWLLQVVITPEAPGDLGVRLRVLLGLVSYFALFACVVGLTVAGAMIALNARKGEGAEHVGRIGKVVVAILLITGTTSLFSAVAAPIPAEFSDGVTPSVPNWGPFFLDFRQLMVNFYLGVTLGLVKWVALVACIISLFAAGGMLAVNARRGEGSDHAHRLGQILLGIMIVSGASGIITWLLALG